MPYVLDESSYRVDKTVFPTADEAEERAAEAARILNRPITVYVLQNQVLDFAFRVLPDGTRDQDNPTVDAPSGVVVDNPAPAVLGRRAAVLDTVAEFLERRGHVRLAAYVDSLNETHR